MIPKKILYLINLEKNNFRIMYIKQTQLSKKNSCVCSKECDFGKIIEEHL